MSDMHLPHWWRKHPEPSPVPAAAERTNRLTEELNRAVEQLRRLNDTREAKRHDTSR